MVLTVIITTRTHHRELIAIFYEVIPGDSLFILWVCTLARSLSIFCNRPSIQLGDVYLASFGLSSEEAFDSRETGDINPSVRI